MNNTGEKMNKRIKFEDIAERRVKEVIHKISLLGNLSNPNNYDYTEDHVKQIFSAIKKEVRKVEMQFISKGKSEVVEFKFKK